jgi:hypothetical protein
MKCLVLETVHVLHTVYLMYILILYDGNCRSLIHGDDDDDDVDCGGHLQTLCYNDIK